MWHSIPLAGNGKTTAQDSEPALSLGSLGSLRFTRPKVVLERGRPGAWDEYGVRDPALLVDDDGYLVRENGAIVLYYTGSHDRGHWQGSGRAVSYDDGDTWHRYPELPVLAPQPGAWDSTIASTPWVIRGPDGLYRMFYRGASHTYFDNAIGLAVSDDGISFRRVSNEPILTWRDFTDISYEGGRALGAVNVVRMLDGRYLMTFESFSASCGGRCQIFAAVSEDLEHFEAFNNGYPLFSAKHVRSTSVRETANPRVTVLDDRGLYVLAYNACSKWDLFSLCLAFSTDLINWHEHPNNPLITPSGLPRSNPFSGRLEGGVLVKEDLEKGTGPVRMFLLAIPREGPSHRNSVLALAKGSMVPSDSDRRSFHTVASEPADVALLPASDEHQEMLCLRRTAASTFPARVHFSTFPQGVVRGLSVDLRLEHCDAGSALLVLGETMNSVLLREGLRLRFTRNRVYVWAKYWEPSSLRYRINARFGHVFERFPTFAGWHRVGRYEPGRWYTLVVQQDGDRWRVQLGGRELPGAPRLSNGAGPFYDVAWQSAGQPVGLRNLRIKTDA